MNVEERIDEAIYQLEKIKDEIVDYDSCKEEAINSTDVLEKIRTILHENKEYMYAGQPIVDKVIEEIENIINPIIGKELEPLMDKETLDSAAKIIWRELTRLLNSTLTIDEKAKRIYDHIRNKFGTNWENLLQQAIIYNYGAYLRDSKLQIILYIRYPDGVSQIVDIPDILL